MDPMIIGIVVLVVFLLGMLPIFWVISKYCPKGVLVVVGVGLWILGAIIASPANRELMLAGGFCQFAGIMGGLLGLFDLIRRRPKNQLPPIVKPLAKIPPKVDQAE
jgi:hypothetical protein